MQRTPLAACLAGLFALPVQANEPPSLDEIVVTATRIAEPLSQTLPDVTVLNAEEIQRAGQATLVELLQTLPGVEINQIGGAGSASSLFIRGANAQHTLVLVDGVPMTSATLGSARLEHIPMGLVERIEVVRGPMSHLYGSEAIGGVVQIFTRQPTVAPQFSASLGAGGYGRIQGDAALTGSSGAWRYALSAGHDEQTGFSAKKAPNDPDKDGYRNTHAALNLQWDVAAGQVLALHGMASDARSEFDDAVAPYNSHSQARLGNAGLSLTSRLGRDWSSRISADFAHENVYTQGDFYGPYASEIAMDQWQYAWQLDGSTRLGKLQTLLEHQTWDIGGDVGYSVSSRHRNALMLGWRNTFGAHGLQANLRHDDDSQFGGRNTGMLGYGWDVAPGWRVVATHATAFRAPSFDDLYWPGAGNPNLRPEHARNSEVGLRFQQGRSQWGVMAYRNQVRDLIQWAPTGPGGAWQPANVASARLQGITLSARYGVGAWNLHGSLDWQDPVDVDTGNALILRSKRHAAFGLEYQQPTWNLSLDCSLQAPRYNDAANTARLAGYGVANLAASYDLAPDWRLLARVENLFDKDYERSAGYNTPQRNLFVGLRYQPH